jgi:tRNA pseudouridine55 synthase
MMKDAPLTEKDGISGIVVVDKEKGMTSHDVVALIRRKFALKKVGHAGTLDPNATGVLVILIGKATKLSAKLTGEDKRYSAVMKLGEKTDSGDVDGRVISTKEVSVSFDELKSVMAEFVGEIEQVPPMFSAKKIAGKRLYETARKGGTVPRPAVKVTVRELGITFLRMPEVGFDVLCTKGTYIRQLADDIGEKLGCGAHLLDLRRISSGKFDISGAVTVSELNKMSMERLNENIVRV